MKNKHTKNFLFLFLVCLLGGIGCKTSTLSSKTGNTTAQNNSPELNAPPPPAVAPPQAEDDKVPRIDAPATLKLVQAKDVIIIDTRAPENFESMRIKGAINIPYSDFREGKFHNLPKDKKLVFYCT